MFGDKRKDRLKKLTEQLEQKQKAAERQEASRVIRNLVPPKYTASLTAGDIKGIKYFPTVMDPHAMYGTPSDPSSYTSVSTFTRDTKWSDGVKAADDWISEYIHTKSSAKTLWPGVSRFYEDAYGPKTLAAMTLLPQEVLIEEPVETEEEGVLYCDILNEVIKTLGRQYILDVRRYPALESKSGHSFTVCAQFVVIRLVDVSYDFSEAT